MPGTVERSNYRLGAPKVAGIGFGEYGNERFQMQDTSGGSSPLGMMTPPAPAPVAPAPTLGGGLPGNIFNGMGIHDGGGLPLTRGEMFSMTSNLWEL
jgi:hypothetical protein